MKAEPIVSQYVFDSYLSGRNILAVEEAKVTVVNPRGTPPPIRLVP
jgi:hypothetical protein